MAFTTASAKGSVSSLFSWDLRCGKPDITKRDEFNIGFVAIDSTSKCRVRQVDSLVVKVKVFKPLNAAPKLTIVNLSTGVTYTDGDAVVAPGQELSRNVGPLMQNSGMA